MPEEPNDITIYFGDNLANLFDVGYISTDINQLISFTTLLEEDNIEDINKYFINNKFGLTRYSKILAHEKKARISDVKKGSVELYIAGAGLLASIIMPIVAIKVQQYFNERNETVQFQINAQDQNVQRLLRRYEAGDFGRGQEGLDRLFRNLQYANYDVQIQNNNIYLIEQITNKYSQRIVRTIKKNQ